MNTNMTSSNNLNENLPSCIVETPLNDISSEENKDLVSLSGVSSIDRNKQLLKIANHVIKQFNGNFLLYKTGK